MEPSREADIQRGMDLAASLPDIMPSQVDVRLQPVYDDIQQVLRVPFVNKIFRVLANYPDYLDEAWRHLRPALRSVSFEQKANELRALALLDNPPLHPSLSLSGVENAEQLVIFNDTIHYVLPKLLLTTTALYQASFGMPSDNNDGAETAALMPLGIVDGTGTVEMVDPDNAEERLKTLFDDVKQRHRHTLISSYYRGLAQWPDFLEDVWRELRGYVGSSDYTEHRTKLITTAQADVADWHIPKIALRPSEQEDVKAILTAFQNRFIPEMLIDAVLVKCLLEGAETAAKSRFSVFQH